jgi:hypothetical protein
MKKQFILTATALFLVTGFIVLQTGAVDIVTAAHPSQITGPISFKNDVQPILERRCTKCHGGNFPTEGLSMESYESLMAGSQNGNVIVAGDSGNSLLVEKIESGEMPKRGSDLTPEQIAIIKQWIDEGALNN